MAGYVGKVRVSGVDYPIAATLYGTCTTAGSTAAKIVTCADFTTLLTGVLVYVKFTYSNTAASPTLNVNGTGAYPIYLNGTVAPGASAEQSWLPNAVVGFVFDGNAWNMIDGMASANKSVTKAKIADDWVDLVYPVGSIYLSVNSTNPSSLFGGTWEQIKDKFLLSAGDTYTAGDIGGSATKNLQHNHTTGGHTLTASEIPSHKHDVVQGYGETYGVDHVNQSPSGTITTELYDAACYSVGSSTYVGKKVYAARTKAAGSGASHSHGDTGNGLGTTQDIMPPYLAVYIWKRTA